MVGDEGDDRVNGHAFQNLGAVPGVQLTGVGTVVIRGDDHALEILERDTDCLSVGAHVDDVAHGGDGLVDDVLYHILLLVAGG